jgi:prevent-host-death family protein
MALNQSINQRDLRLHSKDIMDAVEGGSSFVVTRDGREIGQLVPLRPRRRLVPREEFLAGPRVTSPIDIDRFRADLDALVDTEIDDPYER